METTKIYFLKDPIQQNKGYIGKSNNPMIRKESHFNDSLLKKKTKKNDWINSLKKQGLIPIVEEIDTVPILEWRYWEIFYISLFKSCGFDLKNGTPGGDGVVMSEEIKEKLRNINIGKKHGTPLDETKLKQSIVRKGKTNSIKKIHIIGISLIDNIIVEFNSAYEASKTLFGTHKYSGAILLACRGKIKTSRGFIWKIKQTV